MAETRVKLTDVAKLQVEDLFNVAEDLPAEDRSALAAYLSHFANPKEGRE